MARKSLRPQLNQIRAWVRQGRTDAWIAHQLEVSTSQLREFRKRHDLDSEGEDAAGGETDLRDEIEAEIEAELEAEPEPEEEEEEPAEAAEQPGDGRGEGSGQGRGGRRRRRRRRGRGKRAGAGMQATFDHGEEEGYGLWLDAAIKDDPVYKEHWAGHRPLRVMVEPERIVLERVDEGS